MELQALEDLLKSGPPKVKDSPDGLLYRQLSSLRGPLVNAARLGERNASSRPGSPAPERAAIGLRLRSELGMATASLG